MNMRIFYVVFFFSMFLNLTVESRNLDGDMLKLPSKMTEFVRGGSDDDENSVGTRWAVLIAGSNGYWNYRHQADVCHAYQILKKDGLKDENIIVFMYDDIAFSAENPRPGVIINSPHGSDVYEGVPKDYIGDDVNVNNFLSVILGNKTSVKGGSGKVVDSSPKDRIFIYYADHGATGVLAMPSGPLLFGNDLIDALLKKHALGTYKSMVFYVEACESGSIFEGFFPEGLNIYAITAANASESSWAAYCPGLYPSPPSEYETCLGDVFSVAWLEDSDSHNLKSETLKQQYEVVRRRTLNENFDIGSHVTQYGNEGLDKEPLFLYMGTNPANVNYTYSQENSLPLLPSAAVNQRDADLIYFWQRYNKAPQGSPKKIEALKELHDLMSHRHHIDQSMEHTGKLLFGIEKGPEVMKAVRPAGQCFVDDWDCLKTLVRTFEAHCGSLSQYGMKYMRALANFCNSGIQEEQMSKASAQACVKIPQTAWSSLQRGFSA